MKLASRRLGIVGLAVVVAAPTGCASRAGWHSAGWEVGMVGAMVVGGLLLGRGMMHGMGRQAPDPTVGDSARFSPSRLLEQREMLELDDEQVAALESLRGEVAAGQRSSADAARAAYELLRPVQRAAVSGRAPTYDAGHVHH